MSKIIGIRYIGKKPNKGDTIFSTGAVWVPSQVHNFAEPMGRRLLQHTDSYEEAPVDADGDTFMGSRTARRETPVSVYANLANMDAAQLSLFAKRELNRTVDIVDRDIEAVRAEVHRLMVTTNLDEIADEAAAAKTEGFAYPVTVSAAELEALMSGQLVVKLVPAEVAEQVPAAFATLGERLDNMLMPELLTFAAQEGVEGVADNMAIDAVRSIIIEAIDQREAAAQEAALLSGKQEPTLDELLDSLTTKDELLAFAIQEGVEGLTGRNSVETMRSTISEALKARMAGKPEPGNADA